MNTEDTSSKGTAGAIRLVVKRNLLSSSQKLWLDECPAFVLAEACQVVDVEGSHIPLCMVAALYVGCLEIPCATFLFNATLKNGTCHVMRTDEGVTCKLSFFSGIRVP